MQTKILDIDKSKKISNIIIEDEKTENVKHLEYLGARTDHKNNTSTEIKRRLAIAMSSLEQMEKLRKGEHEITELRILRA